MNIAENNLCSLITKTIGTSNKSIWSSNYFIAGGNPQSHSTQMQSCSTITYHTSIFAVTKFSKCFLKFINLWPLSEIIRFKSLYHSLNIFVSNILATIRKSMVYHNYFTLKFEFTYLRILSLNESTVSHSVFVSEP